MSQDDQRKAFEAWISAPPFDRSVDRHGETSAWPGDYKDYSVELCWEAWQEATRRAAIGEQMK